MEKMINQSLVSGNEQKEYGKLKYTNNSNEVDNDIDLGMKNVSVPVHANDPFSGIPPIDDEDLILQNLKLGKTFSSCELVQCKKPKSSVEPVSDAVYHDIGLHLEIAIPDHAYCDIDPHFFTKIGNTSSAIFFSEHDMVNKPQAETVILGRLRESNYGNKIGETKLEEKKEGILNQDQLNTNKTISVEEKVSNDKLIGICAAKIHAIGEEIIPKEDTLEFEHKEEKGMVNNIKQGGKGSLRNADMSKSGNQEILESFCTDEDINSKVPGNNRQNKMDKKDLVSQQSINSAFLFMLFGNNSIRFALILILSVWFGNATGARLSGNRVKLVQESTPDLISLRCYSVDADLYYTAVRYTCDNHQVSFNNRTDPSFCNQPNCSLNQKAQSMFIDLEFVKGLFDKCRCAIAGISSVNMEINKIPSVQFDKYECEKWSIFSSCIDGNQQRNRTCTAPFYSSFIITKNMTVDKRVCGVEESDGISTFALIGIVIALAAACFMILCLVCYCKRKGGETANNSPVSSKKDISLKDYQTDSTTEV